MLKKIDLSQPPSYPTEYFSPSPDGIAPSGRETLSDDVAAALRVRSAPAATAANYCPLINDILILAVGTNPYFDISQTPNPALDDFKKDWVKVKTLAGCWGARSVELLGRGVGP